MHLYRTAVVQSVIEAVVLVDVVVCLVGCLSLSCYAAVWHAWIDTQGMAQRSHCQYSARHQ